MKRLFSTLQFSSVLSIVICTAACGEVSSGASHFGDDFGFAAEPGAAETGDAGFDEGEEDASAGSEFAGSGDAGSDDAGTGSDGGDTGAPDPREQLQPGVDEGGDGEDGARPEGGVCLDGDVVVAACLESNVLMFDCNPALISSCEAAGFSFVELEPDEVPVDWDCDDYNDWLPDCTGGWLTDCWDIGGSIDCHNEVDGVCYEATCEAPEPG